MTNPTQDDIDEKFKVNDIVMFESYTTRKDNKGLILSIQYTRMGSSKIKPTAKIHLLSEEYVKNNRRRTTTISLDKLRKIL